MSLSEFQPWILPAVMGFLVLVMMRHWRSIRERLDRGRLDDDPPEANRLPVRRGLTAAKFDRGVSADAPSEVNKWQVEMHETARQLKAELDAKMAALAVLIRDAQQQADRLEAAIAIVQRSAAKALDELPPPANAAAPRVAALRDQAWRLADLGRSASSIAAQLGAPIGDVELLLSSRPVDSRS